MSDDLGPVKDPGRSRRGFLLPDLDDDVAGSSPRPWPAGTSWTARQAPEPMLDLTGNPGTHTTKTFASLLIVARAVEYIRRTGEKVVIFSPTSANKGTALRDAVLRA